MIILYFLFERTAHKINNSLKDEREREERERESQINDASLYEIDDSHDIVAQGASGEWRIVMFVKV